MFNHQVKELTWGGRTLRLETGKIARQADGAVLATYGETSVLATVVAAKNVNPGQDFFPLTVNYQERTYAAGRIPGGFFKREGRPSERETLISRLIDRPIRPLFFEGFRNEVQVICTVMSFDNENDPDIVAMVAASAALTISGVPFMGPIGGARVGYQNGQYILNPVYDDIPNTDLDLVVAGTAEAVMMVESEAKELSEAEMLGAVTFGHQQMQPVIDAIIDLAEVAGKEPWQVTPQDNGPLKEKLEAVVGEQLREAFSTKDKVSRQEKLAGAKAQVVESFPAEEHDQVQVMDAFKQLEADIVRNDILDKKIRIDGRDLTTVRPIEAETSILPRTHGSALFTRGETQSICVATLGTGDDEQTIDGLDGGSKQRFLLHYNFPPFSVGETGRVGSPGRREIGHGKLAWRALNAVLPSADEFPYTIRVVSEITESNGSSSMATVCGGSLSMLDAGVPLKRPVAGIAMGLIKEGDRFAVLSDILGDEDHLGDMDFKVAGSEAGVTSLQMDIKIAGITEEIMQQALAQAKDGRLHILGEMAKARTSANEFSIHAPRIEVMTIPVDKIREVIGSGGKVIRDIVETTGAKIDISDDGTIKIASPDGASIDAARKRIEGITMEPEVGAVYDGTVVKVVDFGAFVNFFGSRDGLVHISQMTSERGHKPSEFVKEGETIKVKLVGFDDRGKVRLSMKEVEGYVDPYAKDEGNDS